MGGSVGVGVVGWGVGRSTFLDVATGTGYKVLGGVKGDSMGERGEGCPDS